MRFWMFVVILFMTLTFVFTAYKLSKTPPYIKPLASNLKMIGAIDLDANRGIDINTVREGKDVVMVLRNDEYQDEYVPTHPQAKYFYDKPFDLINFNPGGGVIDRDVDIWPYLAIVVYKDNGADYDILRLQDIGIKEILTPHISPEGGHVLVFTNGKTRILYEVSRFT